MKLFTLKFLMPLLLIYSCAPKATDISSDWKKEGYVTRTIDNVTFTFPAEGYAFENKEAYIDQCLKAMQHTKNLLKFHDWQEPFNVWFCKDRSEIERFTGQASGGSAHPFNRTLYVVANAEETPPIGHELTHLIPMLSWGYTPSSSLWLNEGLATFSENNCQGYTVSEIYRYMMAHKHLIPMTELSADFYGHPEMIAYHQCGYIAQYLLHEYGVDALKRLWLEGFENFEQIYGTPYHQLEKALQRKVALEHPAVPEIDWQEFLQGCI